MSTILNSFSRTAAQRPATPAQPQAPTRIGVRSLSVMLLAAAVSALVILADEYVSVWTDGHLLFGWVVLWAVVFAGLALFAGTARKLAARAMDMLDGWSRSRAASRAEARLWEIAKSDPRVMSELVSARSRAQDTDFDTALAPMGFESQPVEQHAKGWEGVIDRLAASHAHRVRTYYI